MIKQLQYYFRPQAHGDADAQSMDDVLDGVHHGPFALLLHHEDGLDDSMWYGQNDGHPHVVIPHWKE